MIRPSLRILGMCLAFGLTPLAWADCVDGISVAEARQHWQKGQAHEQAGRAHEAVIAFSAAQGYICGGTNPVALEAARRAAPLATELGKALEQQGRLLADNHGWGAFEWYETGGRFAEADRVLMQALNRNPDDLALFDKARRHFTDRLLPSFATNNRVRLQGAGAYTADPGLHGRVLALPLESFERTLEKEAANFSEAWLSELAALYGQQPASATDLTAIQRAQAAEQTFARRWPEDLIDRSFSLLETAREWSLRVPYDDPRHQAMAGRLRDRMLERGNRLLSGYASTPMLLERAVDFFHKAEAQDWIAKARERADQLGNQAFAEERYSLAGDFYRIAGNDTKQEQANALEESQFEDQASAMANEYQAQAQQLQQMYSNPAAIEAMQKQAEAMIRAMQESQRQFQQQ